MVPRRSSSFPKAERTLSIRLIRPLLRVMQKEEDVAPVAGFDLRAPFDPDVRLPQAAVTDLLERGVARTGDPSFGLRAGEQLDHEDLAVLEYAASACATLRSAMECVRRYIGLVDDTVVASLEEAGDTAIWKLTAIEGAPQPACSNDFQLASSAAIGKQLAGDGALFLEAHFAHEKTVYAAEYDRVFHCDVRFDAPDNALVFPRARLDAALGAVKPEHYAAYAMHTEEALRRQGDGTGTPERVRTILFSQVRTGNTDMRSVARWLATTGAALRRNLEQEGTSLSELLDDVRRDLAPRYLGDPTLAVSEVAFLLGFSNVSAFSKAFRRWHPGRAPSDFRPQQPREA